MRVAIASVSNRKIGGIETYLDTLFSAMREHGYDAALLHEMDQPSNRQQIGLPEGAASWCVESVGERAAFDGLRSWQPDLIFAQGLENLDYESVLMAIAPSVFFTHGYHGTCISGTKMFTLPFVEPCQRQFGASCLLHYFPRGCGGNNPLTMARRYRLQSRRLELMRSYDAVVTHSEHMKLELVRHGLQPQRVYQIPFFVDSPSVNGHRSKNGNGDSRHHLIFSGRMEFLKGGHVLLDALPEVMAGLGKPLRVTFAGDGRERARWQRQATQLQQSNNQLQIEFTGWLDREQMDSLLAEADLLVVPSLWPEPFGLVGPEAGLRGVPAAAFAVGGIPDWLKDGVNGALASGDPPTAGGLAQAIIRCLRDPEQHTRLQQGAIETARQFNLSEHLKALLCVFEQTIERRHSAK